LSKRKNVGYITHSDARELYELKKFIGLCTRRIYSKHVN